MPYDRIARAGKVCIGAKQTTKLIEQGKASEVYVAKDADPFITSKIINLCKRMGTQVIYVDSMKQLGKACGIEVGAAVATIVNER